MVENKNSVPESKLPEVISYLTLRKAVGIIGVSLPIILFTGSLLLSNCYHIQGSISKYYHTVMQNVFVGALCAVALFLWAYKGYKRKADDKKKYMGDNLAGNFAAVFALGVAFFPTYIGPQDLTPCISAVYLRKAIGYFHLAWSLLFFLSLAYFSIVLFTKGKKKRNNRLYKVCGYIILVCLFFIVVHCLFLKNSYPQLEELKPIF